MEPFNVVERLRGLVQGNDKAEKRDTKEKGNYWSSDAVQRMWRIARYGTAAYWYQIDALRVEKNRSTE